MIAATECRVAKTNSSEGAVGNCTERRGTRKSGGFLRTCAPRQVSPGGSLSGTVKEGDHSHERGGFMGFGPRSAGSVGSLQVFEHPKHSATFSLDTHPSTTNVDGMMDPNGS